MQRTTSLRDHSFILHEAATFYAHPLRLHEPIAVIAYTGSFPSPSWLTIIHGGYHLDIKFMFTVILLAQDVGALEE